MILIAKNTRYLYRGNLLCESVNSDIRHHSQRTSGLMALVTQVSRGGSIGESCNRFCCLRVRFEL